MTILVWKQTGMMRLTEVSIIGREIMHGGVSILYFAIAYELLVANSFFKKEEHLVTFKSSFIKTQIDYFHIRVNNRRLCKDYKVIPNEY